MTWERALSRSWRWLQVFNLNSDWLLVRLCALSFIHAGLAKWGEISFGYSGFQLTVVKQKLNQSLTN